MVSALEGVSVAASPGEFVAVRGPSGCGKTTLLLLAGGLLRPDAGNVTLDGTDPYALSPGDRAAFRARTVGFVFQEFHLVPYLSVLDNILVPTLARPIPDARRKARELAEGMGLSGRLSHTPGALSTGERQRTALARALLVSPKIILADEPTENLDRENAKGVLERLAAFARRGGVVLLVTHDDAAASFAGRSVFLDRGKMEG